MAIQSMPCLKKEAVALNQENGNSGEIDKSEKRRIELVISGRNSTKPFDFLEEALN